MNECLLLIFIHLLSSLRKNLQRKHRLVRGTEHFPPLLSFSKSKMTEETEGLLLKSAKQQTPNYTNIEAKTDEEDKAEIENLIYDFNENMKHCKKIGDKFGLSETLSCLGLCYFKLCNFVQAREYHEKHLKMSEKLGDLRSQKRAYCNLGCAQRRLGNLDKAVECFECGLKISKDLKDKQAEEKLLNNIGNIYELQGKFREALFYHKSRLDIAKELKNLDGESKAYASLGNIHHCIGNIRTSIEYYEELITCLKIKLAIQDKDGSKSSSSDSLSKASTCEE